MKYNLHNEMDKHSFLLRVEMLAEKGACVDLSEITGKSISQNAYLHILCGVLAMEFGTSLEYAKQVYLKLIAAKSVFCVAEYDTHLDKFIERVRSTAELTKEEIGCAIDLLKTWAATEGISLPASQDRELLKQMQVEIGRYQRQYDIG